jgi:hypothetical protein
MEIERAETKGYSRDTVESMVEGAPKWWIKQLQENRSLMGLRPLRVEGVDDDECSKEQRAINKLERTKYELKALRAAKQLGHSVEAVEEVVRRKFD